MEEEMNIDQLIQSYTYARITGSAKPLDHLDLEAEKIVQSSPSQAQVEIDVLFANDEYEAKLRYIRNEYAHRES
jgi:DNA-binding transcriptional MocR family regulator